MNLFNSSGITFDESHEGLFDVVRSQRTRFLEENAFVVGKFLRIDRTDLLLCPLIDLVSDQEYHYVRVGLLSDRFDPSLHILEGPLLRDIVDDECPQSFPVMPALALSYAVVMDRYCSCPATIRIWVTSVPDLRFDFFMVGQIDYPRTELHSYCRRDIARIARRPALRMTGLNIPILFSQLIESLNQVGLPHTRIASQYDYYL